MTVGELKIFLEKTNLDDGIEIRINDNEDGFYSLIGAVVREDYNGDKIVNLVSSNEV